MYSFSAKKEKKKIAKFGNNRLSKYRNHKSIYIKPNTTKSPLKLLRDKFQVPPQRLVTFTWKKA